MNKARLITSKGDYVCTAHMPPFKEWPDVVTWGTRVFKLETGEEGDAVYREVFAVAIVNISIDDPEPATTEEEETEKEK